MHFLILIVDIQRQYHADTVLTADILISAYRQVFSVADTDTSDTEKCADMPILPRPGTPACNSCISCKIAIFACILRAVKIGLYFGENLMLFLHFQAI